MEPLRDDQLIAELQALRPTPHPAFAADLDERVAAGFPRRPRSEAAAISQLARLIERLRATSPRRLLIPAGGIAVLAIAISTALITGGNAGGGSSSSGLLSEVNPAQQNYGSYHYGRAAQQATPTSKANSAPEAGQAELEAEGAAPVPAAPLEGFSEGSRTSLRHRDVERSTSITLAAEPGDVADDAAQVFEAVRAHHGIVMRSSTSQGKAGKAGARFELLIPSNELGGAMAAFSQIDSVRSRQEATADITAPTVTAAELLKESRARIDSLLTQLEEADTESEREAVEAELRHERRHASRLAGQLTHLQRRADFSRVSLRIVSGSEESSGGAWGFGDAVDDAGRILAVAAAVTLVALAVIGPLALIALLAWLSHRAWVRRQRRRVLS